MKRYLLIGLVVFITACAPSGQVPPEHTKGAPGAVYDFNVDGTRCIALFATSNGAMALQCDF